MKKYIPAVLIGISFAIATIALKTFPEEYATHWGPSGMADGFSKKGISLYMFPFFQIIMVALLTWVPKLDPKKENIEKFRSMYDVFIIAFVAFFTYLQLAMYAWNTGFQFNFSFAMIPGFAVFFWFLADLVGKAKMNYMIGIRTPWTLSSEVVWDKTHTLGRKLIRIGAVTSLLGLLVPTYGLYVFLASIIFPMLYLVWYSYAEFVKLRK